MTLRLSHDLLEHGFDGWIASQHGPVSRSEAILRLAELGLDGAAMSSKAEEVPE